MSTQTNSLLRRIIILISIMFSFSVISACTPEEVFSVDRVIFPKEGGVQILYPVSMANSLYLASDDEECFRDKGTATQISHNSWAKAEYHRNTENKPNLIITVSPNNTGKTRIVYITGMLRNFYIKDLVIIQEY